MNNPKFVIKTAQNGQFHFNLRARNGEIILTASETYTTKQSCLDGIYSVKENAPDDQRYERKNGSRYSFNLQAANYKIIGRSESYTSLAGREDGILAVKRDAPTAPIDDQS